MEINPNYELISQNIGGHGFWGKGGVYTGGVSKKIFRPPSVTKTFFFHLGGIRVGVSAFGRGVCRVIFGSRGGVHTTPHTPTVPIYVTKTDESSKILISLI